MRNVHFAALHQAEDAYSAFDADATWRLSRFINQVRELCAARFFEHPAHRFKAAPQPEGGLTVWADSPGESQFREVVLLFREPYVDENPTSAMAVLKLLDASTRIKGTRASGEARRELRALRGELKRRKREDPRMMVLQEGRSPWVPDEVIQLWLKGEYFHADREKAAALSVGSVTGEMFRVVLHSAVRDFVHLWRHVAVRAEAALRATA